MRDSERNQESYSGTTASTPNHHTGPRFRSPHGKEPHQQTLGEHPAEGYIGYVDDPEDPEMYQMHERDATAQQLIHEVLEISEHVVVDLGDMQ